MRQIIKLSAMVCLIPFSMAISACGGSSSNTDNSSGGNLPPPTGNKYTIGGIVEGLGAAPLVLQNNGGDDLVISNNGTFIFSASASAGAAYSVTIRDQPVSEKQTQNCVVTKDSGSVSGADITDIVVSCLTTAINGINVPADPGSVGLATIAGVDSDSNGIRDDIDIFIATEFGTNQEALHAARISARAHQLVLTTDPSHAASARIALQDSGDAGVCAGRAFRAAGMVSTTELNEIYLRVFNTVDRLQHGRRIGAAAGLFERSVSAAVCP